MSSKSLLDKQIKQAQRKLTKIASVEVPRAYSRSLNRIAKRAQTETVRAVSAEVKLPQKHIRKRIYVRRASARNMRALMTFYRSDVPVISLGVKTQITRRGKGRGVLKAGGKSYPGAFVNRIRSSNQFQVMRRLSRRRYPVEVVKIPLRKAMEKHAERITLRVVKRDFKRELAKDLNYRISKYAYT